MLGQKKGSECRWYPSGEHADEPEIHFHNLTFILLLVAFCPLWQYSTNKCVFDSENMCSTFIWSLHSWLLSRLAVTVHTGPEFASARSCISLLNHRMAPVLIDIVHICLTQSIHRVHLQSLNVVSAVFTLEIKHDMYHFYSIFGRLCKRLMQYSADTWYWTEK